RLAGRGRSVALVGVEGVAGGLAPAREHGGDDRKRQRAAQLASLRQAGLRTALAEANLDATAHELPQKQRNSDPEPHGNTHPPMTVYAVADLIDPKVDGRAGPVRPDA